jgi:hypothetical protein
VDKIPPCPRHLQGSRGGRLGPEAPPERPSPRDGRGHTGQRLEHLAAAIWARVLAGCPTATAYRSEHGGQGERRRGPLTRLGAVGGWDP